MREIERENDGLKDVLPKNYSGTGGYEDLLAGLRQIVGGGWPKT